MLIRVARMLTVVFSIAVGLSAAQQAPPELMFEAARKLEVVDGDSNAAIKQYEAIIAAHGRDRAVHARALVRMAALYERAGRPEAQALYQQLLNRFSDQREAVDVARSRLKPARVGAVARHLWSLTGSQQVAGLIGRESVLPFVEWHADRPGADLYVRDLTADGNRRVALGGAAFPHSAAVSPDGRRIAFATLGKSGADVRLAAVDGSTASPAVLFHDPDIEEIALHDWSSDGRFLLAHLRRVDRSTQLSVITVPEGQLRVLRSIDWRGPTRAFLSRDSRTIAYDLPANETVAQRDVFWLAVDGSRGGPAVEYPSDDVVAGWSADGKGLLFRSDRTGRAALWSVAFTDGRPEGPPELLKPELSGDALGVAPNGNLYYRVSAPAYMKQYSDVVTARFDFEAGTLSAAPGAIVRDHVGTNGSPDWSPDGKLLGYVSERGESTVIGVRSAQTGDLIREIRPAMRIYAPDTPGGIRWSSDARYLAAGGHDARGRRGIHRIDAESGVVSPLVVAERAEEIVRSPAWAPRVGKLYFHRRTRSSTDWTNHARDLIVELDLQTREERVVAERAALWDFELSPDGQHLAMRTWDPSTRDALILVVSVRTGRSTEIMRADPKESISLWVWSPDSSAVVVSKSVADGPRVLWKAPLDGGSPRRFPFMPDPNSSVPRVAPDGTITFAVRSPAKPTEIWVLQNQ